MKKNLSTLAVLACFASSASAATINMAALQNGATAAQAQASFRAFSEDMGAALSYKGVTPPTALGVTGFDIGVEVTASQLQSQAFKAVSGTSTTTLPVPKLHVAKGLPMGFDVAAFYAAVPTTNIRLYGAEVRYAIIDGGMTMPAVGVRGSFSKLAGVNGWDLNTKGLDISVSKGFLMFTPYAGVGKVWTNSTAAPFTAESFSQNKIFAGLNANMGLTNLAFEYDKTGSVPSYSAKLGFRF
ncbi:MAG: hypothetical protein PXX73_01625 [Sideroxydans sp.]|nr:hypothetical protein [Sideroxydans sp.]